MDNTVKVILIYWQFLDAKGLQPVIGGVETYMWNLTRLCADLGWQPIVIQSADQPFHVRSQQIEVIGLAPAGPRKWVRPKDLFRHAISLASNPKDIILFMSDRCSVHTEDRRCLLIQHGVAWDLPSRF